MENAKGFPGSRQARILTIALIAQAGFFYATSRSENIPAIRPLKDFPMQLPRWQLSREGYVDEQTQAVLRADDTLTRIYSKADTRQEASLFVAFFKTQRTGQTPHSPKNCLPGSGWEMKTTGALDVAVPGLSEPIRINHYTVSKGENRSVVLYWYQTPSRVIASEYRAKMWLVADAIRYNRTDTALVRVIVPVAGGNESAATKTGVDFVQSIFTPLKAHLSS